MEEDWDIQVERMVPWKRMATEENSQRTSKLLGNGTEPNELFAVWPIKLCRIEY